MHPPGAVPNRLPAWAGILLLAAALWCMLAGLFAAQFAVAGGQSWAVALERATDFWWPWAVLLPVVCALSFLFPFERPRRWICVGVHSMAVCLALMFSQLTMRPGEPGRPPQPQGQMPQGQMPQGFPMGPPPEGGMKRGPPPGLPDGRPYRRAGPPPVFRTMLDGVVYAGVFCLCQAVVFFRRAQEREKRALALEGSLSLARLEALRLQLNPHFLFNSLNAIAGLVHAHPDAADSMIANVADLLRATLDSGSQQEIPLRRELELLDLYLSIERTRFGERFQCRVESEAGLGDALVPSLILQPLAENAVRHSVERRTGQVTLLVRAERQGDRLRIIIRDTASSEAPASAGRSGHGIGVANAASRMEALYGQDQQLDLQMQPTGCTATLEIPWHIRPLTVNM